MDMSWQTTFALACATVFAAVVPGTLGYATARLETADQQQQELMRLRTEVQAAHASVRQMSAPCKTGALGRGSGGPMTTGAVQDHTVTVPPESPKRRLPPQAKSHRSTDAYSNEVITSERWDRKSLPGHTLELDPNSLDSFLLHWLLETDGD